MNIHNRLKLIRKVWDDAGLEYDSSQVKLLKKDLITLSDDEFNLGLENLRRELSWSSNETP